MKKYNYIRLSKTKKLRYMGNFFKKKLYIIFLPGFMSNIEGEKPKAFKKYAVRKKLGFLTLDYSGHGKSSGKFTKGNISQWSNDTIILIRRFIKKIVGFMVSRKPRVKSIYCKIDSCWLTATDISDY